MVMIRSEGATWSVWGGVRGELTRPRSASSLKFIRKELF